MSQTGDRGGLSFNTRVKRLVNCSYKMFSGHTHTHTHTRARAHCPACQACTGQPSSLKLCFYNLQQHICFRLHAMQSGMRLWFSVCWLVSPLLWSRLNHLRNSKDFCHELLYRRVWFQGERSLLSLVIPCPLVQEPL